MEKIEHQLTQPEQEAEAAQIEFNFSNFISQIQ